MTAAAVGGGRPAAPNRLVLAAPDHPGRLASKPVGRADADPVAGLPVRLRVADARHHVQVVGVTGTGKSTELLTVMLAEAAAGRGFALLDPKGDLARDLLARLPAGAGRRLVLIDPDETTAPAALNVLDTAHRSPDLVTEHVVGVLHRLYGAYWGPRVEDTLRAAVLTLTTHHPRATLADVPRLLTDRRFRARLTAPVRAADPDGLGAFWEAFDALSPAAAATAGGPVLSKLRAVLTRPFAADLFGTTTSTFAMSDVLDGGILIARLPKGTLGEDGTRLVGSLLLAALWQAALARADQPEHRRLDASVIVDECHNFLHLPIGLDDALAEARGLRVSFVLAHQHLTQLPAEVRDAVLANARNKIVFTVSPDDARKLADHLGPILTPEDLYRRSAYTACVRLVVNGEDTPGFTIATAPASPAVPGRADRLRSAARARGLPRAVREQQRLARRLSTPDTPPATDGPAAASTAAGQGPVLDTETSGSRGGSLVGPLGSSLAGNPELPTKLPTLTRPNPQPSPSAEPADRVPDWSV